jgi:hypothetical protein
MLQLAEFELFGKVSSTSSLKQVDTGSTSSGKKNIAVHPNPAFHELTITGLETAMEVTVYDLSGEPILNEKKISVDKPVIDIKSLKPGTYLLKAKGRECTMIRFVKE